MISQTIQALQGNGNKITTKQEMVNSLNSQLQSVFTIECQNNCPYIRRSAPIISDIINRNRAGCQQATKKR